MKLSIIIPVYNLENYIARTLDSLLQINSSFQFEIIAINDGSKDSSEEILNRYAELHDNINVISIPNGGVSNARNFGIKNANGEYITFVDGDDTVEPDFFEKAVRELDNGGYDFVQGNYVVIDNEKAFNRQYVDRDIELSDFHEMMEQFFRPGQGKKIHYTVWGKVFRAEVVRKISFDKSLAVAEDKKYVFDVLCKAKKIKLLKDICVHYYQRESSAIHTFHIKKELGKLDVLNYCDSYVPYPEIKSFINVQRMNILVRLYFHYTKAGNSQATEVRREILQLNINSMKPYLDKKTIMIYFLLNHTRILYDTYIRYFSRGEI